MTGTIYIAKVGSLTKIGHTNKSVAARIRAHRQLYAKPVILLCTLPGTRRDEKILHKKLDVFRVPSKTGYGFPEDLFELPDVVLGFTVGALTHLKGATSDQSALLGTTAPYAGI